MKLYWGLRTDHFVGLCNAQCRGFCGFLFDTFEIGVVEENLRNEFAMSLRFRWSFGLFPSCEVIV